MEGPVQTIAVRERELNRWQVERQGAVLHPATSQERAMILALTEADRSFERGERVQVIVWPSDTGAYN